ncbi:MAG: OsmC family protein [Nanoarchaeota archaeon]|nr:OsmC family protein [Nanoarchaeota archaeon]
MTSINIEQIDDWLFETKIGNYPLKIDVPAEMGGKDRALTPPQIFLASIASCTAAFLVKYCKTAAIDTTGLKVTLEFDKVENPVRLTNFKIKIDLPNAPEEKKKAILKAAGYCPVHESIKNFQGIEFSLNGD